jgi:hypothetical protein
MVLDEIDASDPNVLLYLNTLENGYMSFPDKLVEVHPDFRLLATANPQDNHKDYNGRSKLDAATLDRFDIIEIEIDPNLEQALVDPVTYKHIETIRSALKAQNSTTYISVRDAVRFQQRRDLNILNGFVKRLFKDDLIAFEKYQKEVEKIPEVEDFEKCKNLLEVWKYAESLSSDKEKLQKRYAKTPTQDYAPGPEAASSS